MSVDAVREQLEEVIDPELGINIVDLGLVYNVEVDDDGVYILMTLTSPGCPLHGVIREEVTRHTTKLDEVEPDDVELELTFDPPWNKDKMSDEARAQLGFI